MFVISFLKNSVSKFLKPAGIAGFLFYKVGKDNDVCWFYVGHVVLKVLYTFIANTCDPVWHDEDSCPISRSPNFPPTRKKTVFWNWILILAIPGHIFVAVLDRFGSRFTTVIGPVILLHFLIKQPNNIYLTQSIR